MLRRTLSFGLVSVAGVLAYRRALKPWQERWGTTNEEVAAPLPGDELIPDADSQTTRAISIEAPPEAVWSWLIQVGADRGGFYSYDILENLFGIGIHSAESIVPEWQSRSVGDLVFGDSRGTGGWYVAQADAPQALVLNMADVKKGRPCTDDVNAFMRFTWAFVLKPVDEKTTRLLVRERVAFGKELARRVMGPVGLVSFVMTRKMMLGIKQRAEAAAARSGLPVDVSDEAAAL